MARKRTVYTLEEIKENYDTSYKLLLFKYHKTLNTKISYKELIENNILNAPPMSIVKIDKGREKIQEMINKNLC